MSSTISDHTKVVLNVNDAESGEDAMPNNEHVMMPSGQHVMPIDEHVLRNDQDISEGSVMMDNEGGKVSVRVCYDVGEEHQTSLMMVNSNNEPGDVASESVVVDSESRQLVIADTVDGDTPSASDEQMAPQESHNPDLYHQPRPPSPPPIGSKLYDWNLHPYFTEVSNDGRNMKVMCLLCWPQEKVLSTSMTATANLRKHLERLHADKYDKFFRDYHKSKRRAGNDGTSTVAGLPTFAKQCRLEVDEQGDASSSESRECLGDRLIKTISQDDPTIAEDGDKQWEPSRESKPKCRKTSGKKVVTPGAGLDDDGSPCPADTTNSKKRTAIVSQAKVDELVMQFIIGDLQPYSLVEQPSFVRLVTGLRPDKKVLTNTALRLKVFKLYARMREEVRYALSEVEHVCCSVDMWQVQQESGESADTRNIFYVAVNAHWVHPTELRRLSAALDCVPVPCQTSNPSAQTVAGVIHEVCERYGLAGRDVTLITDTRMSCSQRCPVHMFEDDDEEGSDGGTSAEDNGILNNSDGSAITFLPLHDLLPTSIRLPHERCPTHHLNLIGTEDASRALDVPEYELLHFATLDKCRRVWQEYSRKRQCNTLSGLHLPLLVPRDNSWFNHFAAVSRVNRCLIRNQSLLYHLCDALGVDRFGDEECRFMKEYCLIMSQVVRAAHILQDTDHHRQRSLKGYLLPTVSSLRERLDALEDKQLLTHTLPLKDAILGGISARFGKYFDDNSCILASVLTPLFKLKWLRNDVEVKFARSLLLSEAHREAKLLVDDPEGYSVEREVSAYLNSPTLTPADTFSGGRYPILKHVFLRHNTPLSSSSAVDALLPTSTLVSCARTGKFDDKDFPTQLLLHINSTLTLT